MKDVLSAARSAGVVVHNVRVHRFASSRGVGLVADAAIPAGTRVLEVPERVWSLVSADAARGAIERSNPTLFRRVEAISARMVADAASFEGALHLALQIVGEGSDFREADRDATSFIATWRDVAIPSTLPSLPYFYDAVQLAQLRGSERSARSNTARRQFVAQIHAALFPPAADRSAAMAKALGEIGASAAPSLPQFERALAVVSSRVTTSSDGPGVTLLPVLDWLNHAAAEAVNCRHDYDASSRSFVVDATNDVAARAVAAVVCARVFAVPSDACGGAEAAGLTSSSIARAMSSQLVFAAPVAEAPSWLVESAERVSSTDSMHMPDDLRAATDASSVLWLHAGLRDVRVCSSSALTPSVRASSFRLTRSVGLSGSNGSKSSLMTDTS